MALIAYLYVNNKIIGRAVMVRKEGGIGRECEYECQIESVPHPLTDEALNEEGFRVKHHYNDSPWTLLQKTLEAAND